LNLVAIVNDIEQIIETMWGDPNRWDDWQRRIYKVNLALSTRDRQAGYSLERLDLYEAAVNPGDGSIRKSDENPWGITRDSLIVITGPLYRADTFAFREFELTDVEKPAYAVPFIGYSSAKTMEVEYYDGETKKDRRRNLPPLSVKTARHAVGYLPEDPIRPLSTDRSPPVGAEILSELQEDGSAFVRRKYFESSQ
jgi:hypothetical protein